MKPLNPPGPAARRWLRAESAHQRRRCRLLAAEAEALAPRRAKWVDVFLGRLQARGFDESPGVRRRISPDELPARGRRARQGGT